MSGSNNGSGAGLVVSSVALGASFCCNATLKSAYEVSARHRAGADRCRPQHSPLANRGQLCAGEGAEPSRPCQVVDTAEFCFDTTSMERNFVGGDRRIFRCPMPLLFIL